MKITRFNHRRVQRLHMKCASISNMLRKSIFINSKLSTGSVSIMRVDNFQCTFKYHVNITLMNMCGFINCMPIKLKYEDKFSISNAFKEVSEDVCLK